MKKGKSAEKHVPANDTAAYVVYYLMLLIFGVASIFPNYRVWGLNHWGYYPVWVPTLLFFAGAVLPLVLRRFVSGQPDASSGESVHNRKYIYVAGLLTVVFVGAFYFLRAETHFLGDGYTLLANLASDNPIVKERNYGETLIHQLAYALVGGNNDERALLAYQIVSWLGGLAFVVMTFLFARALFEATVDRILFALGLLSGGYMLLFFGYAEHYSLFVPSVAWFALTGLLVAKGEISRWYILPPLITAMFLHVFGVILIPSAVYILLAGTKTGNLWAKLNPRGKLALIVVAAAILAVVFYHLYTTYYFFRFAFVPIVEDNFTVEGYTMFSAVHLSDIANLVVLLLPGIVVCAAALYFLPVRKIFGARDNLFLLILLSSSLLSVFVFDPKAGMPRDWDLFSFSGVPLAIVGYYTIIKHKASPRSRTMIIGMAIFLGFAVLVPRTVGRKMGSVELMHIENYFRLDIRKNLYQYLAVQEYYYDHGQREKALAIYARWERLCPEWEMNKIGVKLDGQKRYAEAVPYFRRAIKQNAMFAPAYSNLGSCYLSMKQLDSAQVYLTIADGLNPISAHILMKLGNLYVWKRDFEKAEEYFKRSIDIDKDIMTCMRLLELYSRSKQAVKYESFLIQIASRPDAPPTVHKQLGDLYISQNLVEKATTQYRTALGKGLDSTQAEVLRARFPQLSL